MHGFILWRLSAGSISYFCWLFQMYFAATANSGTKRYIVSDFEKLVFASWPWKSIGKLLNILFEISLKCRALIVKGEYTY